MTTAIFPGLPRGRPTGKATEPLDPDKVKKVMYLRNEEHLSWQQIADQIGTSRNSAKYFYHRWLKWEERQ